MLLGVVLITFSMAGLSLASEEEIEKLLKDNEIIPDVLQEVPKELLKIEYDNGLLVGNGTEYAPTQMKSVPKLYWNADPNAYYTVIMTNADPPSRAEPKWREWLHWLVVNVPGTAVDNGEPLAAYIAPGPPREHGLLRYVFFVYKQPGKLDFSNETRYKDDTVEGHENFSSVKFAAKYDMDSVPAALNFAQAQWDEYVKVVHKQLQLDVFEN